MVAATSRAAGAAVAMPGGAVGVAAALGVAEWAGPAHVGLGWDGRGGRLHAPERRSATREFESNRTLIPLPPHPERASTVKLVASPERPEPGLPGRVHFERHNCPTTTESDFGGGMHVRASGLVLR